MTRNATYDVRGSDIPTDRFPTGRIRFSLAVPSGKEADKRRELLTEALRHGLQWDLLKAIEEGVLPVTIAIEVLRKRRQSAVHELTQVVQTTRAGTIPSFEQEVVRYLDQYEGSEWSQKITPSRLKRVGEQEVDATAGDGTVILRELKIDQISRDQIWQAVGQVSENVNTQNNLLAATGALFRWSIDYEAEVARVQRRAPRWEVNPVQKIKAPETTKRIVTASDEQVVSLLAAASIQQAAIYRSLIQCGMRAGELIHTRFHTDLDLTTWQWRIQPRGPDSRCSCPKCKGSGWSPKNKRGHRTFQIPAEEEKLRLTISAWLEIRDPSPGDFVFCMPSGRPWSNNSLAKDFKGLCETAGIRYGVGVDGGLHLHALRHTCGTNMARSGVPIPIAAALLGDTVDEYTKTYINLDELDLSKGIEMGPSF